MEVVARSQSMCYFFVWPCS